MTTKQKRLTAAARREDAGRRQTALAALLELAQGYSATSAQIAQVAAACDVEAWQLESDYMRDAETAGGE
jgi:hypothetical protein